MVPVREVQPPMYTLALLALLPWLSTPGFSTPGPSTPGPGVETGEHGELR
jgi:hypothetical protein